MEECTKILGCTKKQKIPFMQKNGALAIIYRCTEPQADDYAKEVGPAQCNGCRFRVEPPKIAINPVAVVGEVRTKQPGPMLAVGSAYVPCDDRRQQTIIKCCGEVTLRRVCVCRVCEHNEKEVTPTDCELCPLRSIHGVAVKP